VLSGLIFSENPHADLLAGRSARALRAAGIAVSGSLLRDGAELAQVLGDCVAPVVLLRAGAFFTDRRPFPIPPPSSTGKALVAFGAVGFEKGAAARWRSAAQRWRKVLASTGGDLDRGALFRRRLPEPVSIYLEPAAAHELARHLRRGGDLATAAARLTRDRGFRAIHLPALDVRVCENPRVLQLVTSIQIGGAERVALDLAAGLSARGLRVRVGALGGPSRTPFPEPPDFVDLADIPNTPEARADAVAAACLELGADLVHAHLIRASEAAAIKARGMPLVVTLHNMPEAWPAGFADLEAGDADLLLACARAVEAAAQDSAVPVRTCWNGIAADRLAPSPESRSAGVALRRSLGWGDDDFVLACIANPRAQKRLHLVPEIVHQLEERLGTRKVRVLFAGEAAHASADAREAVAALDASIARWQVADRIHQCGACVDPAPLLAASDAFLSTSAFEGLSLAQLEALAAGVPVVATDVGGAREIAGHCSAMHLVHVDAGADSFASRLAQLADQSITHRASEIPSAFLRHRMAARAEWLYACAIRRASRTREPEGLWLITNNFSTGGAQSSARRLLLGLAQRGVKVRAAVVQESLRHPTRGRATLETAGVPVAAVPFSDRADATPEEIAGDLLALLAADPPAVVVFWNLLTSCKVLLADALPDAVVFDVSPGEMFFDSLERWFERPPAGLPYRSARDYGERLSGVVVKYRAEAARAAAVLGARVHVIPNGVPLPARPHRSPHDRFVIGTAARISPAKRMEDLIAAVRCAHARLPRYVLRIAGGIERGEESYARELRRLARGLPVEWMGELSEPGSFLAGLDLFAMISEPAGCPNASLEAMACGLPVVATDVGGAAEQVIDGHTGRLVPARDETAFAEALIDLARNPGKCASYGANARDHVAAHFGMDRMIDDYAQLFFGERRQAGAADSAFPADAAISG
jgi:glycosyltransferase involved in cell wall biosynthesis